jgi:pilus assembly protein CpaB
LSSKGKVFLIVLAGLILVGVGVMASILLVQRFQAAQAPVDVEEQTVKTTVVVLTRDLLLGDRIETGDVELASVPIEIAPRDALTTLEEAIGKIVKTDLIQGEMVLNHNLADPTNNNRDLSFILADDHVLLAFPADDLLTRQNMVKRGDIIDIYASIDLEVDTVDGEAAGEDAQPITDTFTMDAMQRVGVTALVLDIIDDGSFTNTDENLLMDENGQVPNANYFINAILLALNPQDALVLKHLKDTGAVFDIVLRAPTSEVQFDLTPVTEQYIIEYYGLEILP